MAITTLDGYIAAAKQRLIWRKLTSRTGVAAYWESVFDIAGLPGAGVLNVGNTANGLVHTDATAGYPTINSFGGTIGYVSGVEFGSTVAGWIEIYDRLFVAGAYAYNANTTLASQPSYSSRVPGGTDFSGLGIWFEAVTAFTLNPAVTVTYTDQDGNTGATTGAYSAGYAPILGRCFPLPLATGDTGVQKIESVLCATASAGTFNLMVLRPIWAGRCIIANGGDKHDLLRTGMVKIFDDSALYVMIAADSTATGIPDVIIEVANG
mgnify:CR=1 FL=1